MSNFKLSPDLFLEAAELERFKQFLDADGFRKNILENSVSFGLIKNSLDPSFTNARVERDLDTLIGQRTIKIREIKGIDNTAQFIYSKQTNGIPVPGDGSWYWVKITKAFSNLEKGTFSISSNGDLIETTGTGELKKILRGMPNFPSRIKFTNSQFNTLEYDVLEVIDDTHATLQHPATNSSGIATFTSETNLGLTIVGTFTPGPSIPEANKYPFNYDFVSITLVKENFTNTRPVPYTAGKDFYIARIQANQSTVIIQDKRTEFWETKGSNLTREITRTANPMIGIEAARYNDTFSSADKNIVELSWGMRSANWSVDSSNNIVTFLSGNGGKYKSVNDFTNGDLDKGRLYFTNGKYANIISSVKQGSAINLTVDVLDIDNVSTDGGTTFIPGTLFAAPDCEAVDILFTPDPADLRDQLSRKFTFPVNTPVAKCELLVYKDPSVFYNVQYRYKSTKDYTGYAAIPSDTIKGYLTEDSFTDAGALKPLLEQIFLSYTSHATNGFIQLKLSPLSIYKFRNKVDKGDLVGVAEITSLSASQVIELVVGSSKNYQYISGDVAISDDFYFALDSAKAVDGNEFRIHFDCNSVGLSGKNIFIVEGYGTGSPVTLKKIAVADIFEMQNRDGGIIFTMKFDGTSGHWIMSQNYDNGMPYQIKMTNGVIDDLFAGGVGKVQGLFGHVLMDGNNGTTDMSTSFVVGAKPGTAGFEVGDTGGSNTITVGITNLPATIPVKYSGTVIDKGDTPNSITVLGVPPDNGGGAYGAPDTVKGHVDVNMDLENADGGQPISVLPKYYAILFVQKLY